MSELRNHNEKLEAAITKEAAAFLERESNKTALITVTRTVLTKRGNGATLFVSVFPTDKETAALDFVSRNLGELRRYLKTKIRSRAIPSFRVVPDHGERTRDEINRLLKE
jgi:ribosome-binding factor A